MPGRLVGRHVFTILAVGPSANQSIAFDQAAVDRLKRLRPLCPDCDLSGVILNDACMPGRHPEERQPRGRAQLKGRERREPHEEHASLAAPAWRG